MKEINGEVLYCITDVAKRLRVHRATIDSYIRLGYLTPDVVVPSVSSDRIRGQYFRPESVDAFVNMCARTEISKDDELLSSGDVCKMLGIANSSLKYRIYYGGLNPDLVLPPILKGKFGQRRFKKSTVINYLEEAPLRKDAAERALARQESA